MQFKTDNPRRVSKKRLSELESKLRRYGDLSGVVHNETSGNILGGNQRGRVFDIYKCVIEIVTEFAAPDAQGTTAWGFVVWEGNRYQYRRVRWDTETENAATVIANLTTGEWDWDALSSWADILPSIGLDEERLREWNADSAALAAMLEAEADTGAEGDAEPEMDRAEELREKWQTERGQLWAIGGHRLLCGDSTDAGDVGRVMGGEKAGACITDPPWNVGWEYDDYKDNLSPEKYKEFSDKWRVNAENVGATLFMVALSMKTYKYFSMWFPMAERIFAECQNFTQHTGGFMQYSYNPILIWGENQTKAQAGKRDYFIAETNNTKSTPDKELSKINAATRWPPTVQYLVNFTAPNEVLYEPFGGTGTTLLACQNLGRVCRAIEISPGYTAVILERMSVAFPGIDIHLVD